MADGSDCVSPSRHTEFCDTDSLLDWVELLAAETGVPVGIESAVGDLDFWYELTALMRETGRGVDFVTHRRRRGRHRRGTVDFHRHRVVALPARVRPGVPNLRRARSA